jgi:hypothetical protein
MPSKTKAPWQRGKKARRKDRAFDLARAHREVTACWSNECFELWYLLHFQFQNTGMGRNQLFAEVSKKIGSSYQKNDDTIYEKLEQRLSSALSNAERLYLLNEKNKSQHANPSTKVHHLVSMLQKLHPDRLHSEE